MTEQNVHDPGPDAAAATFDGSPDVAANPLAAQNGGTIRIGTASWTDPTMTASGVFYPTGADSAEERLQFYASRFPLVEVDATYYSLPVRRTSELWVERTPPDFTFDIKAHALMTGQPTETKRLPKDLREALPGEVAEKARIYAKDLPDDAQGRRLGVVRRRARAACRRPASSARSCSSTRAGSSPHRRTATRSRRPSIDCARSA